MKLANNNLQRGEKYIKWEYKHDVMKHLPILKKLEHPWQ